jgi:hypothetical protein
VTSLLVVQRQGIHRPVVLVCKSLRYTANVTTSFCHTTAHTQPTLTGDLLPYTTHTLLPAHLALPVPAPPRYSLAFNDMSELHLKLHTCSKDGTNLTPVEGHDTRLVAGTISRAGGADELVALRQGRRGGLPALGLYMHGVTAPPAQDGISSRYAFMYHYTLNE